MLLKILQRLGFIEILETEERQPGILYVKEESSNSLVREQQEDVSDSKPQPPPTSVPGPGTFYSM